MNANDIGSRILQLTSRKIQNALHLRAVSALLAAARDVSETVLNLLSLYLQLQSLANEGRLIIREVQGEIY